MSEAPSGWAIVVVRVPVADGDEVSGRLWAAGVAGIEERIDGDHRTELRAGVPADGVEAVLASLAARGAPDVAVEVVTDDGLDGWRPFARAWRAGRGLVVVPSWSEGEADVADGEVALVLDPGRAFGSGSHPTTRLCLAELEELVADGVAVADVGCGSGVLAVAAALLGAASVVAVDTDPEAVRATAENAARNGVADRILASTTPVEQLPPGAHQVVVANIGIAALVAMAPALVAAVAPGGRLVLSGVLDVQLGALRAAVEAQGASVEAVAGEEDWRVLRARRP